MDGFLGEIRIHSKTKSKSESLSLFNSSLKKKKKKMKKKLVPAPHLPHSNDVINGPTIKSSGKYDRN